MNPKQIVRYLHNLIEDGAPVCIDSRNPLPGSLFFALKGRTFNGNHFAPEALKAGCRLAVVDEADIAVSDRFLLVADVLNTLQQLSLYHREQLAVPMIGITGSNGKTTSKELIQRVLSGHTQTGFTSGNLNNHIGVPLSLLSFQKSIELGIVEMGANHAGEIETLCQLVKPQYGLITNIGKAHLEGFGSYEGVIAAKSELYHYLKQKRGLAFVNGDDDLLMKLSDMLERVTYGEKSSSDCMGTPITTHPFVHLSFKVNKAFGKATTGQQGVIRSRLAGNFNFSNIMAAITIGLYFGVPGREITLALESYEPENNRSQLCQTAKNTVLIDAYNANPSSMEAAIGYFNSFRQYGQTAVLLGDMLELGSDAIEEHRRIFELVMKNHFSMQVFVGPLFSEAIPPGTSAKVFPSLETATEWLKNHTVKDHYILLKGSRGMTMEKLLEFL